MFDAELIAAEGSESAFDVQDPTAAGGHRRQAWRFTSRAECLRCHNPWVNAALAFTGPQLNRPLARRERSRSGESAEFSAAESNQLRHLSAMGCFDEQLEK